MKKIGQYVTLHEDTVLGEGVTLHDHVTLYAGVTIGAQSTVLAGAVLGRPPMTSGNTNRPLAPPKPLILGQGCIIGAHAVLYSGSALGSRVMVSDLATLREGCVVGDGVVIGRGVQVMYDTVIGDRSRIIDGAILTGNMTIEADVFIGPGVLSINDNEVYLRRFGLMPFGVLGPTIRRFAVIGAGANLAAGIEIGMGALVAPSAMVTRDVPPWTVVAGVPARVLRPIAAQDRDQVLHHFGLEFYRQAS